MGYGKIRPQSQVCCFAPKCTECDPSTHFRMEENCVACPKCWWCIPAIIFCVIVFGSIAFKLLSKMKFNFLIISLALDHMQILGLLAGAKIAWPYQIKFILKWFVFFQMDIDVAGPECLARGIVTFENKWIFKVTVPILAMFMCLVYVLVSESFKLMCHHAKKKRKKHKKLRRGSAGNEKIQKRKKKEAADMAANGHKEKLITFMVKAFINIVAGCYIMMTKAAMSIFSCFFPPGDDTGASFMVAQPSEPCWEEDGLQFALIMPAVIIICIYSFGYPLTLWSLYHKNRHIIMRDQVLRAAGKGYTIKTNKDIHFRKRYGILYSYFKPTHYWWVLMFIGRKFFVCAFAVGLRNYPTFQLASMLMVMFCCLLIQVRQRPFMDVKERAELLISLNHKKLDYANSLVQHMTVFARQHHQDLNKESDRMRKLRKRITNFEAVIKSLRLQLLNHDTWWWNLNTLEEFLSTGAVVLMLAGITFDTTFVKNSPKVRGGIAIVMVILLLLMFVFYIASFRHEYKNVKKVNKKFAKVEWAKLKAWRIHSFKENKHHNNKKILPQGLLAKVEAAKKLKQEDDRKKFIDSGKAHKFGGHFKNLANVKSKKTNITAPIVSPLADAGESKHVDLDDLFGDNDDNNADDLFGDNDGDDNLFGDNDHKKFEKDSGPVESVDDLFDLFDDEDTMGFNLDDIFDDGNVFSGEAMEELDFMNDCMAPTKTPNKSNKGKTGGGKKFKSNIDKFLKSGKKFQSSHGALNAFKKKPKKKNTAMLRRQRSEKRKNKQANNAEKRSLLGANERSIDLDDFLDNEDALETKQEKELVQSAHQVKKTKVAAERGLSRLQTRKDGVSSLNDIAGSDSDSDDGDDAEHADSNLDDLFGNDDAAAAAQKDDHLDDLFGNDDAAAAAQKDDDLDDLFGNDDDAAAHEDVDDLFGDTNEDVGDLFGDTDESVKEEAVSISPPVAAKDVVKKEVEAKEESKVLPIEENKLAKKAEEKKDEKTKEQMDLSKSGQKRIAL